MKFPTPSSIKEKYAVPGPYRPLHRKWQKAARRAIWWLFLGELAGLVPCLVIFGISQPDLWRTDMWKIGWDHKLNSNPNTVLYAYANYKPLPKIALIWTKTFTEFNMAISVISLFFLITKLTAFIMKVWYPIVAVVINTCMVGLYATSVYGHIGPDYTDSRYPAVAAWYLRYGCDMAKPYNAYKSCQIAQGSLVAAFYMLGVYTVLLGFAIHAMLPKKTIDCRQSEDSDDEDDASQNSYRDWEMSNMKTAGVVSSTPFTPRTQAFQSLNHHAEPTAQTARYG